MESVLYLFVCLSVCLSSVAEVSCRSGPDMIPARVLKETASELAPVLASIFQQSYDTGTLPQTWKDATITPIYKSGPRTDTARNGVFPSTETFRLQKGNLCFRPGKLVFPSTETSRFHTFPSFRQREKRTTFTRV